MKLESLKKVISKFPKKPGVYRFLDVHKKPLYIGKASNLKNRIISYTRPIDSRVANMVSDAKSLAFTETGSDIEALILESQLVKKNQPKFNIMLRDDKQYFFVAFTDENFSKIFLTHQSTSRSIKAPIKEMIGPFTEGTALKTTLKALRRIFPYCTCKQKHNVMCLNGHIGACLGFCCLKKLENPNRKSYLSNIRAIKEVLNGKRVSLIKRLEREMKQRGKRLKLEEASEIQGKIEKVRRVFENAQIIQRMSGERIPDSSSESIKTFFGLAKNPVRIEGYDVAHIQGKHTVGAMVVFRNGAPDKNSYRKFKIHSSNPGDDTGSLREMLTRRIKHMEWPAPDLVVIDGGMGQLNIAAEILGNNHPLIALTKNNKHQGDHVFVSVSKKRPAQYSLTDLPKEVKNLILSVDAEAHRFAIGFYRSLHKREMRGKVGRQ